MALEDELREALDAIGSEPGSILVRGTDAWIALPPGDPGDVLIIGEGGLPKWEKPENVNFS